MTKKIKLLCLLALFCMVLTACGAKVHTETSFHSGGSGNRIVFLEISIADEGKIEGGFQKLKSTLQEKAPSCIQVNGYEDQNKKAMIYELKYEFSDIEDFKEKTGIVIGKKPVVQWEEEKGAFCDKVSYYEETTTEELIQWVKKIMEKGSISTTIIGDLYEEQENSVTYEGKKVWTGQGKAKFVRNENLAVKDVSVYTTYEEDGSCKKQIKLGFEYEDYRKMDVEKGLAYLHEFSEKFKADPSCNGFSVTLSGVNELETFFKKASAQSKPSFKNESRYSIFTNRFSVKEEYNMKQLLSGFSLGTQVIKDYVSIPERKSFEREKIHHTYALEATKAYNYIGEYPVEDTYYLDFCGGKSCALKKASVEYTLKEEKAGTQCVTLEIEKNGIDFTNNDIIEYYKNLGEKVQVTEKNALVTIRFLKELTNANKKKESEIVRVNRLRLHKICYQFETKVSLKQYFPEVSQDVLYRIILPDSFSVEHVEFCGRTLKKKDIKAMKDGKQWTFERMVSGNNEMSIKLGFSRKNMVFYGVLSVVVLFLIGMGLSVYFYVKSNQQERGRKNEI